MDKILRQIGRVVSYQKLQNKLNKKLIKHNKSTIGSILNDDTSLPLIVNFETRTKCNSYCNFCPASIQNEIRPDTYMSWTIFKKAIQCLKKHNYGNMISMSLNNEPLMDKHLLKRIKYARENLPDCDIKVVSNGMLLSDTFAIDLVEAGINIIEVSNYLDSDEQYERLNRIEHDINLRYPYVVVNFNHNRSLTEFKLNRGGRLQTGKAKMSDIKDKDSVVLHNDFFCLRPFVSLAITTDGRIGMCCFDNYFDLTIGNVKDGDIIKTWHNDTANKYRNCLLSGSRSFIRCCKICNHFYYDDSRARLCPSNISWFDNKLIHLLIEIYKKKLETEDKLV